MKQVTQNVKNGQVNVPDVPVPVLREEGILVRTRASLISAGTEKMVIELASKSLVGKARERPDLVQKVLDKLRRDGFLATIRSVKQQLDKEMAMGYSAAGEVIEVGAHAREFEVGQGVACAGASYANHAEVNYIPRLLAAPIPQSVNMEAAAYSTVGTIALQGIRNADIRFGETVVVVGLGLIGQLSIQILKAIGCRSVGLDPSPDRVELAAANGADLALVLQGERTESEVLSFTRGRGADAILIAAATKSSDPVELAGRLARDRAKVVMVGITGIDIPRAPYFKKELTFLVSRSYGPGRYDPAYEEHGHDYPAGYVRWTENRNMESFLDLVDAGSVRPEVCTTHRFPIDEAEKAYELILQGKEPHLGVVLTYPEAPDGKSPLEVGRISLKEVAARKPADTVGVSFVGAGGFARAALLPNVTKLPMTRMRGVVTASGISARAAGNKFGFDFCAAAEKEITQDTQTDVVFLATPHSQHADGVCRALAAGKAVFVEKPLAINMDQLRQVNTTIQEHPHGLMVGFNRRFSPLGIKLKTFFQGRGPLAVQYRCNAGPLAAEHWISDPTEGGRIIGEACHFFDLFAYLTGSSPQTVFAAAPSLKSADDALVTVAYENGSVCQLTYTSAGSPSFSKERIEVFAGACSGVLEDFRRLELHGEGRRPKVHKSMQADKGHAAEISAFISAVAQGQNMPIQIESLLNTTLVSFAALRSIEKGVVVAVSDLWRELLGKTTA